jgi:hypothetical protein
MKPSELYDLAREVYRYITANQLVSRGIMNAHFRTSSDDRRNRQLSEALEALLARLYVYKYTDEGTTQVFFWTHEFKESPYEPDDEPTLDYTPIDCFGARPTDEVAAPPVPTPAPVQMVVTQTSESAPVELDVNTPEFKAMARTHEKLKGLLRGLYGVMMAEPFKRFGKHDEAFSGLVPDMQMRARFLGRMFGIGTIRRFSDPTDPKITFYTIYGVCPDSLIEDQASLSKSALRRQAKVQEAADRQAKINSVKKGLTERAAEDAEDPEAEDHEDADDSVEEADNEAEVTAENEVYKPDCYVSNNGEILIRRKTGEHVDLDADESLTVIESFMMLNMDVLVERIKRRIESNKEQE